MSFSKILHYMFINGAVIGLLYNCFRKIVGIFMFPCCTSRTSSHCWNCLRIFSCDWSASDFTGLSGTVLALSCCWFILGVTQLFGTGSGSDPADNAICDRRGPNKFGCVRYNCTVYWIGKIRVFAHPCNVHSLQKFGVDATDNLR